MADAGQVVGAGGAGETKGSAGAALAVVSRTRQTIQAMPPGRKKWLGAGLLMLASVIAGMMWMGSRTDWRVLFSGLEGKDVQQISQELAAANIPFEMTPDNTGVQVPAEMLDKARMEVAAKGMPQSGRLGFELFDKPNWVGSEFDEKVNYQRALEGELEHTIGTLGVVRSARVHLVLPKESLFATDAKVAKASVVLKLKRASLTPEQTESIRNLVAGAVENLTPEQVTLVDADGRANLDGRGHGSGAEDAEQAMEAKLVAMLEPLAGVGNVRAVVNVSYDQTSEERTDEVFDPTQAAPLSVQKSEQVSGSAGKASGVPGTASNTPAASPQGAVQGSATAAAPGTPPLLQGKDALPVYPQSGGQNQSMKQESATYGVSKHTVHSEEGPGRLERVSAAVVVNDRQAVEGAGKLEHAVWKPRTPEEMHRLEELAQAAVGFDARRGDKVVMENVSFSSNAPEVKTAGVEKVLEEGKSLMASQPGMMRTGMMGLVGLLLVWFVLRPVAGQVVVSLKEPALIASTQTTVQSVGGAIAEVSSGAIGAIDDGNDAPAKGLPRAKVEPVLPPKHIRNGVFDQVAEHIKREPAQSTRLLETWIADEGDNF